MDKKLSDTCYEIANITDLEANAIRKAESILREETGKEFILIAWEKDKVIN